MCGSRISHVLLPFPIPQTSDVPYTVYNIQYPVVPPLINYMCVYSFLVVLVAAVNEDEADDDLNDCWW